MLVHRTPEVMLHPVDLQEHFIDVPSVAQLGSESTQFSGKGAAECQTPIPDTLVSDADASLCQDQLDIA